MSFFLLLVLHTLVICRDNGVVMCTMEKGQYHMLLVSRTKECGSMEDQNVSIVVVFIVLRD